MINQNRPYNAVMLQQNLHGAVGKAACVKLLVELAKEKKLVEGKFGKQKIYWINQEGLKEASVDEIKELDEKIKTLKEELNQQNENVAKITSENRRLEEALTDEELEKEIIKFENANEKLLTKLEKLRKSDIVIDPKERETAIKKWDEMKVNFLI